MSISLNYLSRPLSVIACALHVLFFGCHADPCALSAAQLVDESAPATGAALQMEKVGIDAKREGQRPVTCTLISTGSRPSQADGASHSTAALKAQNWMSDAASRVIATLKRKTCVPAVRRLCASSPLPLSLCV
jgi:hypothetical protein